MQEFTTTELRTESAKVYNLVMTYGKVSISHRDRPRMVLMTEDRYLKLTSEKKEK